MVTNQERLYVLQTRASLMATYRSTNRAPVPVPARLPFPYSYQVSSGRCWLFAYINELQLRIQEELGETIQLSRDWVFVYHLFSQLRLLIQRTETYEELNGTSLNWPYLSVTQDSFYPQFAGILREFGIVPYEVFPNNQISTQMHNLVSLLNVVTVTLRTQVSSGELTLEQAIAQARETLLAHFELPRGEFVFQGESYTPQSFCEYLGFQNLQEEYLVIHGNRRLSPGPLGFHMASPRLSQVAFFSPELTQRSRVAVAINIPFDMYQQLYNTLFEAREAFIIGQASFVNRNMDRFYGESVTSGMEDLVDPQGNPTQEYLELSHLAMNSGGVPLSHKICRWSSPEELGTGYHTVIDSSHSGDNAMWVTRDGLFADTYEFIVRRTILQRVAPEVLEQIDVFSTHPTNNLPSEIEATYGFN